MNVALRNELVAMASEDQRVRAELAATGVLFDGYHPDMRTVHDRNAARLSELIERVGWPGRGMVGEDGARAAWLILQHSIGHPELMRRGLAVLREAAPGEVDAVEVAMLEDRLALFEGRPQTYGTQYDWTEDGELVPCDIADPSGVDDRRRALGLPPLADNSRRMRAEAEQDGAKPPADWHGRRRKYEEWARAVGWRE